MIPRYTPKDFAELWSPERRFEVWLDVELAACEAMEEAGLELGGLEPIGALRASPALISEKVWHYLAEVDLGTARGGDGGGLRLGLFIARGPDRGGLLLRFRSQLARLLLGLVANLGQDGFDPVHHARPLSPRSSGR